MLIGLLPLEFSPLADQVIEQIRYAQTLKDLPVQMFVGLIMVGVVSLFPFFLCNVFGIFQAYFAPETHFTLVSLNTQAN